MIDLKRTPAKPERAANGYFYTTRWCDKRGGMTPAALKTKDESEANRRWLLLLSKTDQGEVDAKMGHKTIHWCMDYYEENQGPNVTVGEQKAIKRNFNHFRKHFPENQMVHDMVPLDTERYIKMRRETGKSRQRDILQDGTIINELTKLRTAFNYAVKQKKLPELDLPTPETWNMPDRPPTNKDALTRAELDHLLDVLLHAWVPKGREGCLPGIYILAFLCMTTGQRLDAVASLKWTQLKWKKGREWEAGTIEFKSDGRDKTKKRRAESPITDFMLTVLKRAYAERAGEYVCVKYQNYGALFAQYAKRAGFVRPDGTNSISMHYLRHTYITLAMDDRNNTPSGVSQTVACSLATIERVYTHTTKERKEAVADSIFKGKTPSAVAAATGNQPLRPRVKMGGAAHRKKLAKDAKAARQNKAKKPVMEAAE
jgi:integrase